MNIENQELNQIAMEIISAAGDAAVKGKEAMDQLAVRNFERAQEMLDNAQQDLVKAHNAQTEVIQGTLAGKETAYSILFSHAQDTLMTIESELRVYQVLLNIEKERKS